MATVIDLRRTDDPRDSVHRTVESLAKGQVVALPTETVYGLAADALNPIAVQRLAEIKGRSPESPLVLAMRSPEEILDYVCNWSPLAQRFARRCMPGPLTLVAPHGGSDSLVSRLPAEVQSWLVGEGQCVGFRVVDHPVVAQLHQYLRGPLVLTSANLSGKNPSTSGTDVVQQFGETLPLILNDGPTRYGGASTVVRVMGNRYEILRHGAIEAAAMNDFAKPLIVLVCTGNTCRSPMAEGLLKHKLAGLGDAWSGVNVISAGVAASDGAMASQQAIDVMDAKGIDIACHESRPLSDAIMHRADVVLTMTRGHRAAILAAWPEMSDRVFTLRPDGGDIADPVGGSVELYEQCARQIEESLDHWFLQLSETFLPQRTGPATGLQRVDRENGHLAPPSFHKTVGGDQDAAANQNEDLIGDDEETA
jgi:tRNA threonylcarbamoyl adenosine modification protein (Sua5/YciO/YrdC/YwlC family)